MNDVIPPENPASDSGAPGAAPVPPIPPAPPAAPAAPESVQPQQQQSPHVQQQPVYGQPQLPYGQPQQPYGHPQQPYAQPQQWQQQGPAQAGYAQHAYMALPAPAKSPLLSVFSLIAGIVALLGSPIVFVPIIGGILGLFVPAAAVVLGFLGKAKEPEAKGFWLTGMILGFVGLALALISLALWAILFGMRSSYYY